MIFDQKTSLANYEHLSNNIFFIRFTSILNVLRNTVIFLNVDDLDLRKNDDSAQKCEKVPLALFVTTRLYIQNSSSLFPRICPINFFLPAIHKWNKTLRRLQAILLPQFKLFFVLLYYLGVVLSC